MYTGALCKPRLGLPCPPLPFPFSRLLATTLDTWWHRTRLPHARPLLSITEGAAISRVNAGGGNSTATADGGGEGGRNNNNVNASRGSMHAGGGGGGRVRVRCGYCKKCKGPKPARAHHCHVCDQCIVNVRPLHYKPNPTLT